MDVLQGAKTRLGFVPNSVRTMARRPEMARAFNQLANSINGPTSTIDPQLRNLISQMTSRAAGCGYSVGARGWALALRPRGEGPEPEPGGLYARPIIAS